MLVNDSARRLRRSSSFEVAATAPYRRRGGQLMAAYSATKRHIPLTNNPSAARRRRRGERGEPNAEISRKTNTLGMGRAGDGFVHTALVADGVRDFDHRSGTRLARTVLVTAASRSRRCGAREPIGSIVLPTVNLMNFRLANDPPAGTRKLDVRLDLYNALNINTWTGRWCSRGDLPARHGLRAAPRRRAEHQLHVSDAANTRLRERVRASRFLGSRFVFTFAVRTGTPNSEPRSEPGT
jgi:hypothetical protein